jgi:multidrug transporter EmrE-like cation transporter
MEARLDLPISRVVIYLLGYGIVSAIGYLWAAHQALPISTPYAVWVNPETEASNAVAA